MKETIKLMEAKALKEHKCERSDITFGNPAFGEDVGHGRKSCVIRYAYRERLKGTIRYNGKNIKISQGSR